jgi:isocitrate dehydrogenase (NAD+)
VREDAGVSVKAITEAGSERIVRFAFDYTTTFGRAKVTAAHKANIMKFSDGLFLDVARRVALDHPEVAFEDRIIDALCMQLVQRPAEFDVLVMPNMYGDMVSELGAGLIGGTGVAPGGHFGGPDGLERGVFEATHGTAQALAGTDVANPVGLLLSGAMLLRFLGERDAAERLQRAVATTLAAGHVTADIAFPGVTALGTRDFTDAVIASLSPSSSVA